MQEVVRIRLDGGHLWDIRQYASEKAAAAQEPWVIEDGRKPLSDRQLWRYIAAADRLIGANYVTSRKKLFRNHVVLRQALYRRALLADDFRAAQSVLADLAKLQDLYPTAKVAVNVGEIDRAIESLLANLAAGGETPAAADAGGTGGGNAAGESGA